MLWPRLPLHCGAPAPRAAPRPAPRPAAYLVCLLLAAALPTRRAWSQWGDGSALAPPPRAEHSMSTFNDSIYVFGGRGNTLSVAHDPRTFSTERVDGTVVFTSYAQKHVIPCLDAAGAQQNVASLSPEAYAACYNTTVGLSMNDVWHYNLNCTSRSGDRGCAEGWARLVPGALQGGCRNYNDAMHCTHPAERYGHAAAILYEAPPLNLPQTRSMAAHLVVYGGASAMCTDYCSDMWALNLTRCSLNSSTAAGCAWVELGSMGGAGPGKRWRAASAHDATRWVLFGGHRLWHGMAKGNSAANNWTDTSALPFGGFLDDLWVYTWDARGVGGAVYGGLHNNGTGYAAQMGATPDPSAGTPTARELSLGPPTPPQRCSVPGSCALRGAWQQVLPRAECFATPDGTYSRRNALGCVTRWPPPRASAALALSGETLYLFGGYSVAAYPYPHTYASGSADGPFSLKSDGHFPFPAQPQFLGDLWAFDFRSGLWRALGNDGRALPPARRGHTLALAGGSALILTGGYAGGAFLDDLWLYNVSIDHWLRQNVFQYPRFAPNCTSDFKEPSAELGPLPIIAAPKPGVSPPTFPPSVFLEVTRGTTPALDGRWGRASAPLLIPTRRRGTFGWDGCRDRLDGRTDLPEGEVNFLMPSPRAFHGSIWSQRLGVLLSYGGETAGSLQVGDTWAWGRDWCPFGCHGKGACVWGHCYCAAGFYGLDCSNRTCPGSVCRYDTDNHEQTCLHCCTQGWLHADGEGYTTGVRKGPCTFEPGAVARGQEVNGVCDGALGVCQCAPPYLGDDCSMKDCPRALNGGATPSPGATPTPLPGPQCCTSPDRGMCSVEYPVSRCLCTYPFTGDLCQAQLCLNNCSYPNGLCDTSSGLCTCAAIANPFDATQGPWSAYAGDDCSWVPAFAGAGSARVSSGAVALGAAAVAALAVAAAWGAREEEEGGGGGGGREKFVFFRGENLKKGVS
jgi:hypothetical protein